MIFSRNACDFFKHETFRQIKYLLYFTKILTLASSLPRGYRSLGYSVVVAAWLGMGATYGQSSPSELEVPVQVLKSAPTPMYQQTIVLPGYTPDPTKVDPLSYYQRTRLGRWKVSKDIDREDAVFGIQLQTPARTIRIRCETTINGKPFRAAREKTIDEYFEMAQQAIAEAVEKKNAAVGQENSDINDPAEAAEVKLEEAKVEETKVEEADADEIKTEEESKEPEKRFVPPSRYVASPNRIRLAKYARSRGDLLTRYELRRRLADISGGPALLRTADDFGGQRHQTMTLFAFLDTDQDGVISQAENSDAVDALAGCDLNSNGTVDLNELQRRLNSRSAKRAVSSTNISWQSWDANQSGDVEDLSLQVSFNDDADKSNLKIGGSEFDESWDLVKVDALKANSQEPPCSSVLLSHPKVSVVLSAAQPANNVKEEFNQVSIAIALEANALFRALDRDGDWRLSKIERRSCQEVIASLDLDSNGTLEASELPILMRVCIGRGASAHKPLLEAVSIVNQSDRADLAKRKNLAPQWFVSMDEDGDLNLTREEFLGNRESFNKIDTNENERLSVEEVLATKLE